MREAALITASCVLFIQMGLSRAIQDVLHIDFRIVSCPKCLTYWMCLVYLLTHDYGIVVSIAASFIFSYAALWMALAYDALATLYNYAYTKITGAAESTQAGPASTEDGPAPGSDAVPQMQIDDEPV